MAVETMAREPSRSLSWNDPWVRGIVYQVVVAGAVAALGWYLVNNTLDNLQRAKIASGFSFLDRESGFAIGESLIEYSPASSYGRAFAVGLLNTLRVAVIGIVLSTVLGTAIGIARLSSNWLIAKLSSLYVEVIRNVPLLLQLFFWYALITENMPGPRQAANPLPGVYISNRGFKFPLMAEHWIWDWCWVAVGVGTISALWLFSWARERQNQTGKAFPLLWPSLGLILGLPLLAWLFGGAPTKVVVPELRGFNFQGGGSLTPEFAALLIGLTMYTAGFIAEIVRAGILAVPKGQWEAAGALGLKRGPVLRLIVLPQALRVIVPPMTSQYLNITKNSSLAVAIGYPDVVSIANTTMNQTGQAIEGIALIMAVYLTISLLISAFMNWYNKRVALVER
ncbi:MAG: amino acid ABC transporter permease [Alphaproteobacteria bacterium]|nr:amino acid ABC transporter permease [Alphaproteobacteria bacterium]